MTELDEALQWVREQSDIPAVRLATAYRAGQAASAERIKALEGLLREIEPYSNFIPWFDLQNRFDALLKEPIP
jgi:hypothetical protein